MKKPVTTAKSIRRLPHAAVVVWNYRDRIGSEGTFDQNTVTQPSIISTVSCISIETSKSKSHPAGSFQIVLAPTKNWVAALTPGSWCVIMMSNKPITKDALLNKADPELVKMVGKIETVRCETRQVDDTRQTLYFVSGTDWGHIFNNSIYIDPLIAGPNDPPLQGNQGYIAIRNLMFKKGTLSAAIMPVSDMLKGLTEVFGNDMGGWKTVGNAINRLASSEYDIMIPQQMANFFDFRGVKLQGPLQQGATTLESQNNDALTVNNILQVKTGKLSSYNTYTNVEDAAGYIDPLTVMGTNTFWQILMENSNPTLNEMYSEIEWQPSGNAILTLYNRIKPFSYKKTPVSQVASASAPVFAQEVTAVGSANGDFTVKYFEADGLRSMFQNIKFHNLDPMLVTSVNVGTNWRDKYNFIEVKPTIPEMYTLQGQIKQKTQLRDHDAFNREGFRPLILNTKQVPVKRNEQGSITGFNFDALESWTILLREWFFDTHKLLNGTLTMQGSTEYLAVGNNVRFPLDLVDPTVNMNSAANHSTSNVYVLAHIENVGHKFGVGADGARTYTTTIQFVRGIIVDSNNKLVGEGTLDRMADAMTESDLKNRANTLTTTTKRDGDPDKTILGK